MPARILHAIDFTVTIIYYNIALAIFDKIDPDG